LRKLISLEYVKLAINFSLEEIIYEKYMYMTKLAAQVVTSTPPENLIGKPYEIPKSEFRFWHSTDLDFIRPVNYLRGGHLKKI
jgi:hypothetical protein